MTSDLTPEASGVQATFRAFADTQVDPIAASMDVAQQIDQNLIGALATAGFLGSHIPTEYGGAGYDLLTYGLLHEALGAACSATRSLLTVHDMVCEVIHRLGRGLRDEWLPELTAGRSIAAFALTEPANGSSVSDLSTTATVNGDSVVINGHKKWISFATRADLFLVLARMGQDGSVGGVLVPADSPGLTIRPITGMLGMRASMLGELDFTDCRVPTSHLVGSANLPTGLVASTALHLGRYSVAWSAVGVARTCMERSYRYSGARQSSGHPIGDHQLIKRLLTDMTVETDAARLMCVEAGRLAMQRDQRSIEATFRAKYFATGVASRAANSAVQIHGAAGASSEHAVERHFRDARMLEIIEGSNEIQQVTIADLARRSITVREAP